MNANKINSLCLLSVLSVLFFVFLGCNEPKLKSAWRDREINVDGSSTEWQGCDQYYDEDSRTRVGMLNDETHLYILLSTHDQDMKRQIRDLGLTVWFDPKGGKEKIFGIRFPVGMPRFKRINMRGAFDEKDSDLSRKKLEAPKMELQILGPDKYEQKTMLLADVEKYGIDTKVGEIEGNLIYELKMPITQNEQIRYAVRTDLAKRIGVGFETGKPDLEEMPKPFGKKGGGPGPIGRRPPGGMGDGGPPEGMFGPHSGKPLEPLELWTKVSFAKS